MRLLITSEQHFYSWQGTILTQDQFDHGFWSRYLNNFDHVYVLARVLPVRNANPKWHKVEGECISVLPLPDYSGPWDFMRKSFAVVKSIYKGLRLPNTILLTVPGTIALVAGVILFLKREPYGVVVCGDPDEVFSPGVTKHVLRRPIRTIFTLGQKLLCRRSAVSAYVTEKVLQKKYPSKPNSPSFSYSNVQLSALHASHRTDGKRNEIQKLVIVGTLGRLYKGQETLLQAMAKCRKHGCNFHLTFVGDGIYLSYLKKLAEKLDINHKVTFCGAVPSGDAVNQILDQHDLFVLPSLTEGLPRALIEAMARGLPCIASNVGGIPELLPDECLVSPGDSNALATKIMETLANPDRMNDLSKMNLERASKYLSCEQEQQRLGFLSALSRNAARKSTIERL